MKGSRVVVLGGTQGIGLAVAELAAREGANVVVASSKQASVDAALARLPKGAAGHTVDLRSPESIETLFASLGTFDHLVYTAGEALLMAPLAEVDFAKAREFFEVRYWGALAAVKAAKARISAKGSIVLTSGTASRRPHPGFALGSSICAAMEGFTRAMAVELAPVRVNIVVPGLVDTGLWSNVPADTLKQMFADVSAKMPVGRVGLPEDIAEQYVCFMRSRYTTGQAAVVDGGGTLV